MDRHLTCAGVVAPSSIVSGAELLASAGSAATTATMRAAVIDADLVRLRSQLAKNHMAATSVLHRYGAASIDDIEAQKDALCGIISACSEAVGCHEEEWTALNQRLAEARAAHTSLVAEQHNVSSRLRYVHMAELNSAIV